MPVENYLPEYDYIWDDVAHDPERFFERLHDLGRISDVIYETELMSLEAYEITAPIEAWRARYPEYSIHYPEDGDFIDALYKDGEITTKQKGDLLAGKPPWVTPPKEVGWREVHRALYEPIVDYIVAAAQPILESVWSMVVRGGRAIESAGRVIIRGLWAWLRENVPAFFAWLWKHTKPQRDWLRENVPEFIDWVGGHVRAAYEQYWPPIEAKIEAAGEWIFDMTTKHLLHGGNVTPEMAPGMAMKMFGIALGAGITAHALSAGFELVHPLKSLGFHQMTAMVAQLGSFGPVSAATLGQMHYAALRRPMGYAMNKVTRSNIPDDKLLIEFRSKREIDKSEFLEAMAYQGFNDHWIDVIEEWQWKDPRMLEIMRMSEDPMKIGPPPADAIPSLRKYGIKVHDNPDWWLERKFMRAGYEDCDIPVLIAAVRRKEVHNSMTYFRTAIRRNYRWGFLTEDELKQGIEDVGLGGECWKWIMRAGELDRDYFFKQDLKAQYKMAYRNDLIDSDELHLSLLLLGLPIRSVRTIVTTEKIRKAPRVRREVAAPKRAAMSKIQTKHTQLYIEQYRKGLIDRDALLQSLMAIDIRPELAELTCELEETKLLPKPKLESVYP